MTTSASSNCFKSSMGPFQTSHLKLRAYVSAAASSISTACTGLNPRPASSKPRVNPPAPENRSSVRISSSLSPTMPPSVRHLQPRLDDGYDRSDPPASAGLDCLATPGVQTAGQGVHLQAM